MGRSFLIALLVILPAITVVSGSEARAAPQAASGPIDCGTVTLTVRPGLNPPVKPNRLRLARDIPAGPFYTSLPVYPDATALQALVESPFPVYPADPYLATGSAEYSTPAAVSALQTWYIAALTGCGWVQDGRWNGTYSIFTSGLTFHWARNRNLEFALSFGANPAGGTYLAYAVERTVYPPRPPGSYLRGTFVRVNLAVHTDTTGTPPAVHLTIRDPRTVARLVGAVNRITGFHTVLLQCTGDLAMHRGPVWYSFVRADGSIVHAFETGPGECFTLAVNGQRWLIDHGRLWHLALTLTGR